MLSVMNSITGAFGFSVIKAFLTVVNPRRIIASARDPTMLTQFSDNGIRGRQGGFSDPASMAKALEAQTNF